MGFQVLDVDGKIKEFIAAGATGATGAVGAQGVQGEFPKWNKHFGWVITNAKLADGAGLSDTNKLIHGFSSPATESAGVGGITTVNDARNCWRRYVCTATTGNSSRVAMSTGIAFLHHSIYCSWRIRTGSSIASMRLFVTTDNGAPDDADVQTTTSVTRAGFRYSTVASDTGFVPFVWDGIAQSTGAALSTVATNTEYYLELIVTNSDGFISGAWYVTKAGSARVGPTTIAISDRVSPFTTVGNRVGPSVTLITQENVAKTIDVAGMWQNSGLAPFEKAT
jgi:hypothetical protein